MNRAEAVLRDMMEAGTLRSVIDRRFALSETAEAIEYMEQGRSRGKNVITVVQENVSAGQRESGQ